MRQIIDKIKERVNDAKEMLGITKGSREYVRGYKNCLVYFDDKFINELKKCQ